MSEASDKIKALQSMLGVVPDGLWGPQSQAALDALVAQSKAVAVESGATAGHSVAPPVRFLETKRNVEGRGSPPDSFLAELVAWASTAPAEIFEPNTQPGDIYPRVEPILGPWIGEDGSNERLLHRRAVMCEALRCLAGFESSWNWEEGVDTTNQTSMRNIEGQETGIFQVSHDSLNLDKEGGLKRWLNDKRHLAIYSPVDFISAMKEDHELALEYCARLLRVSYKWDGPIVRQEIDSSLSISAVDEFMRLLA